MTLFQALAIALGGGTGALVRAGFMVWLPLDVFPVATLLVNVGGTFLLGLIIGFEASGFVGPSTKAFAAMGFCGALTTFSTFSQQTFMLLTGPNPWLAVTNVFGSVALCLLAFWLGMRLSN